MYALGIQILSSSHAETDDIFLCPESAVYFYHHSSLSVSINNITVIIISFLFDISSILHPSSVLN